MVARNWRAEFPERFNPNRCFLEVFGGRTPRTFPSPPAAYDQAGLGFGQLERPRSAETGPRYAATNRA
jgi:hypothetical protein